MRTSYPPHSKCSLNVVVSILLLATGKHGLGVCGFTISSTNQNLKSLTFLNVLTNGLSSRENTFHRLNVKNNEGNSSEGERQIKIEATDTSINKSQDLAKASKREMLNFAIPALGIFLTNPMLSNIDNMFVGRTTGTFGLAALSPATICTDQMLYLFSFLSRATTGIVSRAYATGENGEDQTSAARDATSAPLTVSIFCGIFLSMVYALFTPRMLSMLNVNPSLRPSATSYIYIRGAIASAALAQSVALSTMLATRDAITPLKIIGLAGIINIFGDAFLCAWPFSLGCTGAATATAAATLVSSGFMLRSLSKKKLLPVVRKPTKREMKALLEFTGPLFAITITRLTGFISMQRAAMKLGVQQLAGYQLCVNVLVFFLLFGEPLSQISQTKLPAFVDREDGDSILATLKSTLTLASFTAMAVASVSFALLMLGSSLFSADVEVQLIAKQTAPSVFISIATSIMAVALDGAMLASREFGFMLSVGTMTTVLQLILLPRCTTLGGIFGGFTMRLGIYSVAVVARLASGKGAIGRALKKHSNRRETVVAATQ
mmetsp:Transcript_36524/g.53576  ORF Transcript_36524/g.53576 Transcript_36524/m.53576 type:complete len:548 (+) Transcript_36524:90-1733(+)